MSRTKVRTTALLGACAALTLLGCDAASRLPGTWQMITIDGVGPGMAAPLRVVFPAGAYGPDTIAAEWMWNEVELDSLVLTLLPDGTFQERMVEAARLLVRKNTYVRPDYVSPAFGGNLIREQREPGRFDVTGSWSLTGDSIILTQTRDQAVASMAVRVGESLTGASEGEIRDALDRALTEAPSRPRWSGMLRGERLELRDGESRIVTFRKAGSAP